MNEIRKETKIHDCMISCHGYFDATTEELKKIFGHEDFFGRSFDYKSRRVWDLELHTDKDDTPIRVYDWKLYRAYPQDETITWHISAVDEEHGKTAEEIIKSMLEKIRK